MFRSRTFHRVASIASVFVLTWTVADLSNYDLCALDQEGFPSPAEQSPQDQLPTGSEDIHFDDCFCCSHCVRLSMSFSLPQVSRIQQFDVVDLWDAPSVDPREFYHPPKLT